MKENLILNAFEGKNASVPLWLMRQAGRYLPEYQAIKKTQTLDDMFRTPEVASRVTLLPVELLGVDAAILFADILTLPSAMGFDVQFIDGKGPVIANPIESQSDLSRVGDLDGLSHVSETIKLVNKELPAHIPLIGFAGAPFTVASYLIKGRSALGFQAGARFAIEHPSAFHNLMQLLTRNTITYLNLQKEAGIKVFQLFDTWGGILRAEDYRTCVLPYVQDIFKSVDLPSIYFLKNCSHLLDDMEECGADFLSVCDTVEIGQHPVLNKTTKGVQGNLYNGLLYGDEKALRREVRKILTAARGHHKKYIFNLNHGIFPDISVDQVKVVIDEVHQFQWS